MDRVRPSLHHNEVHEEKGYPGRALQMPDVRGALPCSAGSASSSPHTAACSPSFLLASHAALSPCNFTALGVPGVQRAIGNWPTHLLCPADSGERFRSRSMPAARRGKKLCWPDKLGFFSSLLQGASALFRRSKHKTCDLCGTRSRSHRS